MKITSLTWEISDTRINAWSGPYHVFAYEIKNGYICGLDEGFGKHLACFTYMPLSMKDYLIEKHEERWKIYLKQFLSDV